MGFVTASRRRSLLVERFDRVRRDGPDRNLVYAISERRAISAGEIWGAYLAWRSGVRAAALPPATAVVSLLGNRAALFPFLLATRDLGLIPVMVDSVPTQYELDGLLRALRPSAVVARPDTEVPAADSVVPLPAGSALHRCSATAGEPATHAAELFKLTSGSAGVPKAVACSELNLVADGEQIVEAMGIGRDDVNLGAIPLSHSYGLGNLVMPLLLQGTSLVLWERFTPHRLLEDASRCGVTVLPGVPYMYDHLLQRLQGAALPGSLRLLLTAGARIRLETVLGCRRAFGRKLHSFYGSSETGGIAFDDATDIDEALPVGRPLPGVTVTLRAAVGEESGLVHVRGRAVAEGYATGGGNEPESGFVDGGFLTGDLGRFRDDALVLTGRKSGFLNVAGRKVQPAEIERVLLELPEVEAARVFSIGSATRGEIVVACLVPVPEASIRIGAVRGHCSRRLSPHKVPRRFVLADELPVDTRGKVSERALRALVRDPDTDAVDPRMWRVPAGQPRRPPSRDR